LKKATKKVGNSLALAPKPKKTAEVNIVRKTSKEIAPDLERELKKAAPRRLDRI
jgi:hypothetical protein